MNEGWTSVEDKMPETLGCQYLVSAIDKCGFRRHFIAYISLHTDGFLAEKEEYQTICENITHWMPLPHYNTTTLRRESDREKSERYICTYCGGICYFPHGKNRKIWYKFCPCCGSEVQYETER